jgi:hypothetical protein
MDMPLEKRWQERRGSKPDLVTILCKPSEESRTQEKSRFFNRQCEAGAQHWL